MDLRKILYLCREICTYSNNMNRLTTYTINIGGKLMDLGQCRIMGIVNVTPDSFYSHCEAADEALKLAEEMLKNGADIIDIGGCSTRPGAETVDEEEEWNRISPALKLIRDRFPDAVISVDTFQPLVAKRSIEEFGVQIINDVSGGNERMFEVVSSLKTPYILTFNQAPTPADNGKDITQRALLFFAEQVQKLRDRGQNDIILDPGFGFNKSLDENYQLLNNMENLQIMELPILVGVSRKSMISKVLNISPEAAINGTTTLDTIALTKGANILRVHDVKEAKECVGLFDTLTRSNIKR